LSHFQRAREELLSTIEYLSQRKYKLYTSSRIWTEDAAILKLLRERNTRSRPHVQAAVVVPHDPELLLDDPEFKIYTDAQKKVAATVHIEKIYVFETLEMYGMPAVKEHLNTLCGDPTDGRIDVKVIILGNLAPPTQ